MESQPVQGGPCRAGVLWLPSLQGDCFSQGRTRDPTPHPKRGGAGREMPAASPSPGRGWPWCAGFGDPTQSRLGWTPMPPSEPSLRTTIQPPGLLNDTPTLFTAVSAAAEHATHASLWSSPRSSCEDRCQPVHPGTLSSGRGPWGLPKHKARGGSPALPRPGRGVLGRAHPLSDPQRRWRRPRGSFIQGDHGKLLARGLSPCSHSDKCSFNEKKRKLGAWTHVCKTLGVLGLRCLGPEQTPLREPFLIPPPVFFPACGGWGQGAVPDPPLLGPAGF